MAIAVAGCGPAGLAAALLLHRDGHEVTLFERFEAPQPLGSGLMLQPTGLAALAALGLDRAVLARGARIERLTGEAGGRVVLSVAYAALRGERFGLGIHRAALFDTLHRATVDAGIAIRTGCAVQAIEQAGTRQRLICADGSAGSFDLIVDALGARSPLVPPGRPLAYGALWTAVPWTQGFDSSALQQRYCRASVMAGVLPIGEGRAAFFWSLRADRLDAWRRDGLATWKTEVETLWPATRQLLEAIHSPEQMTFARYAHRTHPAPAGAGVVHIGDAWHSTSPQLGQGANMALLDAHALALALRTSDSLEAALARMVALRRRHVWLYQAMSRLLTPVYQSDGRVVPFARDRLVGPLSRVRLVQRIQAAMVTGLVGDPLGPLGLR